MSDCKYNGCDGIGLLAWIVLIIILMRSCDTRDSLGRIERKLGTTPAVEQPVDTEQEAKQ